MKSFVVALPLFLATLGLAAPSSTLQKRNGATVTLYTEKNFQGEAYPITFDITEKTCVNKTFPANINAKASSVQVTNDYGPWNCRLYSVPECNDPPVDGAKATWFWNWDIADLDKPCDPAVEQPCTCDPSQEGSCDSILFDNKARSIECNPVSAV